ATLKMNLILFRIKYLKIKMNMRLSALKNALRRPSVKVRRICVFLRRLKYPKQLFYKTCPLGAPKSMDTLNREGKQEGQFCCPSNSLGFTCLRQYRTFPAIPRCPKLKILPA
ncbi:MAG: hypothetical protein LBH84_03280, partial [Prevotellaceae bacterium]|nr:hypothetical protein [Prevotellaceae bacterium]